MGWSRGGPRTRRGYHHGNLREALIRAALELIGDKGPAGFTFHGVIHDRVPDGHCVMHVHTTPTMGVCCLDEGLEFSNFYAAQLFGKIAYHEFEGITVHADEEALALSCPAMSVLTLVENAVRHGVEPADRGGVIRVRTRVKLGRAVLSIANSVPKAPSRPGNGIALRNVRERLQLIFGDAAHLRLAPNSPRGTVAEIEMPAHS